MDSDLWRWADPSGQQRTVSISELRAALAGGLIAPNTPVWKSGWPTWQPAHEVPELTSASLGGANGVVLNIPPPPLAMVAVQQEYEAASGSIAPMPPAARPSAEPPPPPAYVPVAAKASVPPMPVTASSPMKTQIAASAIAAPAIAPAAAPPPAPMARQTANLPTAIGLPPPPMALAKPPPVPPAPALMVEELSASSLLDSGSDSKPAFASPKNGTIPTPQAGLPPPTDPIVHGPQPERLSFDDAAGLPRRPGLSMIFDDIAAIRKGEQPKNKLLLGVIGALGLAVLIMLVAGVISLFSGPSKSAQASSAGSASSSASAPHAGALASSPVATATPPPEPPPAKADVALGDCASGGEEKLIAPRAVIASGIEARAFSTGIALAFAATSRDAVAASLDPSTLAPTATVRTRPSGGDARHVTPLMIGGKLSAVPDVDRRGDRLAGRHMVAITPSTLVDVGHMDGAVQWAPHGRDSFAKLFSVDGEAQIDAIRAVPLTTKKGFAVVLRRGNSVLIGVAKGENVLEPDGNLSTIPGLGQVGSPAIAVSGDKILAAWADRAGAQDDWKIRLAHLSVGGSTEEATTFVVPEGGLGSEAMSPSIAPLGGGGRFFIAWTEGPVSNHQVRAIAVGADGTTSGAAIAISASGINAGQPAAAIGADGRGAVAFLAAKGKALEVHGTPVTCGAH